MSFLKKSGKQGTLAENVLILSAYALILLFVGVPLIAKLVLGDRVSIPVGNLLPVVCAAAVGYVGCALRQTRTGETKPLRIYFRFLFAVYVTLLLDFTLFNGTLGRGAGSVYRQVPDRAYYMEMFTNFTPFGSIYSVYIKGFFDGRFRNGYLVLNLLGNLCAFMPFSFFLPTLWKSQRKWFVFVPTVLTLGIGIEGAQLLTMRGSCDIDDVILNVGGAVILYFVLRIPPLQRLTERFTNATRRC